jgi:hypothetical protein
MMNARRTSHILVAFLALLAFALPAAGEPGQGIIVNGAAVILEPPVSATPPPSEVEPRVVVEYANKLRRMELAAMAVPPQVPQRVVVEYANAILRENLVAVPGQLPVSERVVVEYANEILRFELFYPLELINDTVPPEISDPPSEMISGGTVIIIWTTDEFADSEVMYGEQSGQYTQTAGDPHHVKDHAITLTGLTPGTTYYYRVRSTDLSGNTTISPEYSFIVVTPVYLPLVMRNNQ